MIGEIILEASYRNPTEDTSIPALQGTIGLYRVPLVTGQGVYREPLDYTEYHWSGGNQGTIGKGLYKEPLLRC